MKKVGNIYQGGGGLKKVGNIRTGFTQPQIQQPQIQQPQGYPDNSWQGIVKNTITGIPNAIGQIGNQIKTNPLDTLKSIGSGVYKGIEPLIKLQQYTNPASLIPQVREAQKKSSELLGGYKPQNEVSQSIQSGFEQGGAMVPYMLGGEAVGATKLAQASPRLAQYLGFAGTSQLLSDKKITDVKDRAEQAALDTLLFGLTGGLRGKKTSAPELQKVAPDISPRLSGQVPESTAKVLDTSSYNPIQAPNVKSVNPLQEGGKIDPVQKVIQAIKEAKPIRGQQEALYSAERAKRVAKLVAMGEKVPGEQGYFAQLGQLKGQLPKANFEGIRTQLTQPDVDALFNQVEQHNLLTPFEKITAKGGLAKLLGNEGGQVPTKGEISLLSEVFPKEFVDSVLEKRSRGQILMDKAGEILNVPRSMMASFDLSAPLRQGAFLIGKPKQWLPAFKDMFKYAFSEKAYQNGLADIQKMPTYGLMRETKLALTDMSKGLAGREERFMSNLAEKIPGAGRIIRGSDRAYTGFLNKLRANVFDDLVSKLGKDQAPDISRFVNSATGRGELPQMLRNSHAVLNGAFFSPRLMASRINMLNPQYYMSLSAPVRKEALKSLLTFGGTVATVLSLAKMGGADVGTDPRSADFGKIKVGDTRYDILGGFQQYAVLASRLATNEMVSSTTGKEFTLGEGYNASTRGDIMMRFLQSKESPVIGFLSGLFTGKDNMGQDFNIPAEAMNRFIPMFAQDMSDLMSKGSNPAMAIPGTFGVGLQTYTDQVPVLSKTPTGQPNIQWNPYPSLGEKAVNAITGTELSQIPQDQWQGLAQEKSAETQRKIQLDAVKQRVLDSGKSERVGDTFIYLQNGIVKTKKLGNTSRTPVKDQLLYQELQKRKTNPFYQ